MDIIITTQTEMTINLSTIWIHMVMVIIHPQHFPHRVVLIIFGQAMGCYINLRILQYE